MTLTELMEEVIYLTGGEPVNLATITKFTNKCMATLSTRYDTACLKKSTSINCTDNTLDYSLPADCIGVYKVKVDGIKYNGFMINEDGINFNSAGTYTVEYYATPVLTARKNYDVNIKNDIPPINAAYHKCIPKYIACELLKISNPRDGRIKIYLSDFATECQEADIRIKTQKRKGRRMKAPIWA